VEALGAFDHEIINLGMFNTEGETDLTYIETALMSAICIHLDIADFIVGGCGTGQGYMNTVLQFPKMFCGLLTDPVEAWLFGQVNAGNCISLQLNKGYGALGGDINLRFLLEKLFSVEFGCGYPAQRREIQSGARQRLKDLSAVSHRSFDDILKNMDQTVLRRVANLPVLSGYIRKADNCETKNILLAAQA
jgi:ribose 5-phosphate isomerase RpiB